MANDPKYDGSWNDRPYYRSLNEWARTSWSDGHAAEFPPGSELPIEIPQDGMSRRRFISLLSASAALALGTSCSRIDRGKIVPYTKRPEEIIPGVATYYASTFQEGLVTHGVLVKTREGRPIHVEGNAEHPLSNGKASLRAIADVLGLYDPDRLRKPFRAGASSTWEAAEEEIGAALTQAQAAGRPVLLLTGAIVSPSQNALIADLKKAFPALRHAAWEPVAPFAELVASRSLYGEPLLPRHRLDRAEVVLALEADPLGTDGNASPLIRDFASRRRMEDAPGRMNRLWVLEGSMTVTGANADHRFQVRPSKIAPLIFGLARHLNESMAVPLPQGLSADTLRPFDFDAVIKEAGLSASMINALANDLKRAGKSSLVMAGSSLTPEAHAACHLLNVMLGAEGSTVDTSLVPASPDLLTFTGLQEILRDADRGTYAAAIFWGANPAYAFPDTSLWKSAVAKIPLTVRIGLYHDETAGDCRWALPEHHWLEGWGDFEPATDLLSLRQPTIGAIHDTRQAEDILLWCLKTLGASAPSTYMEFMRARWEREVYPANSPVSFEGFWDAALHDGVLSREASPRPPRVLRSEGILDAVRAAAGARAGGETEGFELVIQPGSAVYDGRYANNGWLNELPDPVTKATWGNPILLSIPDAERLGVKDSDLVRMTAGGASVEAAVIVQPGQSPGVAVLALGQGRLTGSIAQGVGVNAYPLIDVASGSPYLRRGVTLARTGGKHAVPRTQEHHRTEGRDLVRRWTLEDYRRRGSERDTEHAEHELVSLIPAVEFPDLKWGMAIDLSACVGCSACVIACQSENNIPVVGPAAVEKGREMHWIRIDRYYEGEPEDPSVVHLPVLCQHCDDAPCEIVCPVNATTHSPDGLNQMAYNRCVGTRYCSNNCPYKVRRFNFFDYTSMKKDPEKLVYNPEVTVRPRGVMEKCSFCIQRIQDVKQKAKTESRPIRDGEIMPACAVACPAEAIVFGNLNDPESKVARISKMDRGYHLLSELGVKPVVTYLADIANPADGKGNL